MCLALEDGTESDEWKETSDDDDNHDNRDNHNELCRWCSYFVFCRLYMKRRLGASTMFTAMILLWK